MSRRSLWEDFKDSAKKPFQTWKKKPKKDKKPSPEQGGASSTSGTVASGVAGCSGESKQAHHEQGPKQGDVRTSTSGGIAGAPGGSKQVHYEKGRYLDTGVSEGSMAQRLKLRKRLQERTAKHGVPPPLSIKLTKMSDLPKKFKPWSDDHLPVDILLLTTEDCEFLACYTYIKNAFKSYHKDVGIVYFGNMGESEEEPLKVALMRCSEGSSGPGGSQTVTKDAVMQLRPKAIYSVGCCEGLNPEDTNLGDVVVSSKLTTETFKTPVGRDIANLIKNAADGWNPPLKSPEGQEVQVHCDSEILSGIDPVSTERHHQLNPDAIAVETEGKGIFVAAHDLKIEWVIVKGISHFADESNAPDKSWKSHACVMAASLVSNMLHAVVFEDWPHYEDKQSVQKESLTSKGKEDKHAESAWLGECQRQLRTIYTAMNKVKIVPWEQSSAVHVDEIYTELSWLKDNRKPSGVTREKLKNYTDIFTGGKHSQAPKRILVYGRPGIGKTVFTQKTIFDWSQQRCKGKLGTFELVLLVKLRHVRNFEDVPSLLRDSKLLAADGEISVDELYHYVRDHQEKVLLILDGYDENGALNQSPVREIWERRQLRDCCVVITTRHMKADELRGPSDAQFEIDGFDSVRQVEFARRFLKDEEDVEAFLEYLEQQDLEEIAEIPLLLLMLCLVWQEKDRRGLPTSRAKIYDQFIQTFFDHLFERIPDAVAGKVDDYTDELCQLGNLAFDALLLDSLSFPLSKLPDHGFTKKLIDVGLFHILNLSSLNRDQGVFFLHKSLQEYLASRFLTEELSSEKSENTPSLDSIDSIEKILTVDEVFKFACELSEKAASAILSHLGMVAKKEGLTEYSFMETPSHEYLSDEQRNFLTLCGQCFFSCSAEMRRDIFPAFLSYTQDVLLLTNSSQLHIIANEHLLKTTESPNYIFFSYKDSKHPEEDYYKLIMVVQDLNAVVVSCSGEKKASEFLKKYQYRSVDEFFLKKEQNTYLYFVHINKSELDDPPFPTEMLKELTAAPESTAQKHTKHEDKQSSEQDNRTGLFFTKDSDSTSCSAHCLSMVWDINANNMDRSEMEVLTDVIPLVIAPREIRAHGKTGECDAQLTETLVTRINYTNRLKRLGLININLTAKSATIISNSLHKVPNLSDLHLSYNPLGEGVSVLIKHLRCVPHLERLVLHYVMMTKEQVHDLTTAVRQSNISGLESDYHDEKGNPRPEHEWLPEEYWTGRYPILSPDSSSEKDEKGNPKSEDKGPSDSIPTHVQARGKKALAAYHRALQTGGSTYDKRVKILLVGQDRVGKTSLSKSLRGEPFNENEPSTDGVQMIAPVKDAGTEAWRNRSSLENTTIFDHKIAVKVTRELLSTSAEPPSQKKSSETPIKDVTGDKIQEPTRVASNETFHTSRKYEHPIPSTAGEKRDLDRQHTKHQDVQQKTIERNQEQDRENKKTSPHVAQEKVVTVPEECAFLVQEQLEKKEVDQDDKIWPVIWDFAGQDIYRAIHPIFMSSEDIYLLVSDLTKKLSAIAECRVNLGHKEYTVTACDSEDTNFDHLLRWLDLIHSLKKGGHNEKSADGFLDPPVILVGTHADCVDDPRNEIKLLEQHCSQELKVFADHIRNYLAIDNRQAGKPEGQEESKALRKQILELADKMPHTKKKIPLQWHRVEKEISKNTWQRKRYLMKKTFQEDIVSLYCTFDNEDDFDELIYFLHGRGSIVYHEDSSKNDGLVILDPQWLISVLCEIIKVKSHDDKTTGLKQHRKKLQENGILSRQLIDHACRNQKVEVIKDKLISLMDKFNLICQWPTKENGDPLIIVPCMLTTEGQGEISINNVTAPVYLTFEGNNYVPYGLFCRLVVLFGKWLSDPRYTNEYELHANEAQFAIDVKHFLRLVCYKTVIKLQILTEVGFTPLDQHYNDVLSHLKEFLVTLKKECHWLRSMSEELCVRCTICLGTNKKVCVRHEKEACVHHDCSHYIPLKAKLCCKPRPGNSLPLKPLQPWIGALNLFTSRDTTQSHPGQSGVEKSRKRKSPSEDAAIVEARRDVRPTDSVQEPPRKKQALATHHEEGATTKMMGDVQLSEAGHTLRYLQQVEADAKQVASKTDLSVALKRIASDKGFIVSDNRGSGNCMFYALSEQLAVVKGIRISHEKLRQSIVEYLKDNHTLPDGTELFNFVPGYSSWDAYLTNMAADGTWGDHVILHGAANCFKTYIHVISSLSHQHDLIISPGCEVDSSNPLVLGHVHELHYVSLIESKRDVEKPTEKNTRQNGCKDDRATGTRMSDVQSAQGLRPQQRYEPQLMAGQGAVEQGPDKTKLHEGIVTSEGTDWDLKVGAVHLRFPPNAVSEPTSIVVHKWKYSACSPPLQEHEAIVSNVIEISTITGQALEFNVEVKLFLSHSAPDLQGYELVIKKQIDKESNEWEDVDGTEDLKCLQGIKDDIPPHKDILDMFFPVARVDITKCSTYAVVCRLKSSPPYTITSSGGSFSHPDYPGVTVTIPENAVAPEAKFPLELKVQEVLSEDFEGKDVFIGPILRISCPQVVQFLKPVTIQLPASLRDEEQEIPDPSTCRVRVFFLRSDGEHKEWIEITGDLAKPAIFDGKCVMFEVERFSGYGACVDCGQRNENVSVTDLLSRTNYVPIQVFFFACFRPDSQEILLLYCCPAHLRSEMRQELEREDIKFSDGSSKVKMTPERDDKVFVFLSGGIEAFSTKDMEDFNLLLDRFSPSKLELRVRLVSDRDMAQVEFRSNPKPERSIVLCKLYPPIPTPRVQDMGSEGRTRQHGVEKPTEKNTRQNGCKDDRATGTTMSDVQPAQENKSPETASDPPEVTVTLLKNEDLPENSVPWNNVQLPVDILLLAPQDCEFLACVSYLNPDFCKVYRKALGYVYLGNIGKDELKLRIAVMKCHEGSTCPGGSAFVVTYAVKVLMPKAVFCVGFCGGLNFNKVNLGDVVVSKKLITYAPSKVTENAIEERGVKVPLKSLFSMLIPSAGEGWKAPLKDPKELEVQVHRGAFLSGPEVVYSNERRNALIERFPEAIAIEMEGEGLYAAAHHLGIEWIVIKGVSNYADGRKSETKSWRQFASLMAASLTAHILSDSIVFQDWRHYRSRNDKRDVKRKHERIPGAYLSSDSEDKQENKDGQEDKQRPGSKTKRKQKRKK